MNKQEFIQARDLQQSKLRDLENSLASNLNAAQMIEIPRKIGETRATIFAMDAKISLFEEEELDEQIAEAEAIRKDAKKRLQDNAAADEAMRRWASMHLILQRPAPETFQDPKFDETIKSVIKLYAENLKPWIEYTKAKMEIELAAMEIADYQVQKREVQQRREAQQKKFNVMLSSAA